MPKPVKQSTIVVTTTITAPAEDSLATKTKAKDLAEDVGKRAKDLAHDVSQKAGEMLEDVAHDLGRIANDIEKKAAEHAAK
jgi:hypothetical protein